MSTDDATLNNPTCCIPSGDLTKAVCATAAAPCDTDSQYTLACDESADCAAKEFCFFGNGNSNCDTSADNFGQNGGIGDDGLDPVQLCRTNAECTTAGMAAGTTCALKTCTCGLQEEDSLVSIKLKVCGTPSNCQ